MRLLVTVLDTRTATTSAGKGSLAHGPTGPSQVGPHPRTDGGAGLGPTEDSRGRCISLAPAGLAEAMDGPPFAAFLHLFPPFHRCWPQDTHSFNKLLHEMSLSRLPGSPTATIRICERREGRESLASPLLIEYLRFASFSPHAMPPPSSE